MNKQKGKKIKITGQNSIIFSYFSVMRLANNKSANMGCLFSQKSTFFNKAENFIILFLLKQLPAKGLIYNFFIRSCYV